MPSSSRAECRRSSGLKPCGGSRSISSMCWMRRSGSRNCPQIRISDDAGNRKSVTEVTAPLGSCAARRVGSTPTTRTTSEQALYRLLRLFYKSQSALTPLLLLSKSNPLRWASIWFLFILLLYQKSPRTIKRSAHKTVNSHNRLNRCVCSCILSRYVIRWNRTYLQIGICKGVKLSL